MCFIHNLSSVLPCQLLLVSLVLSLDDLVVVSVAEDHLLRAAESMCYLIASLRCEWLLLEYALFTSSSKGSVA